MRERERGTNERDWVGCSQTGSQGDVAGVVMTCWVPGRLALVVDQDSLAEPSSL